MVLEPKLVSLAAPRVTLVLADPHASPSAPSPPLRDIDWIISISSSLTSGVRRMGRKSEAGESIESPLFDDGPPLYLGGIPDTA